MRPDDGEKKMLSFVMVETIFHVASFQDLLTDSSSTTLCYVCIADTNCDLLQPINWRSALGQFAYVQHWL